MDARTSLGWCGAAAVFAASLWLHKPVSDVCDLISATLGFRRYDALVLLVIAIAGLCVAVPPAVKAVETRNADAARLLILLGAASIGLHQYLLVANIELIHLPQYALLCGFLLVARVPPRTAWFLATACGVVDESYQHLVIYADRPDTYLDFNDMFFNAVGAGWAVFAQAACPAAPRFSTPIAGGDRLVIRGRQAVVSSHTPWILAGLSMACLALAQEERAAAPFFRQAATGRVYHVLTLAEGALLSAIIGLTIHRATPQPRESSPVSGDA